MLNAIGQHQEIQFAIGRWTLVDRVFGNGEWVIGKERTIAHYLLPKTLLRRYRFAIGSLSIPSHPSWVRLQEPIPTKN
ncbi:MAG TPA: hypothetical protein V6C85_04110 [Allocoleopsis sp.]